MNNNIKLVDLFNLIDPRCFWWEECFRYNDVDEEDYPIEEDNLEEFIGPIKNVGNPYIEDSTSYPTKLFYFPKHDVYIKFIAEYDSYESTICFENIEIKEVIPSLKTIQFYE